MKKSKLLISTLAIASVGATVAPIVTSCNKGYGGIKIEDDDWTTIATYFEGAARTHQVNFTTKGKDTTHDVQLLQKFNKEKVSSKEDDTETFLRYNSKWQYYDGTKTAGNKWQDLSESESDPDNLTSSIALLVAMMGTAYESEVAEFKNGAYQLHNEDAALDIVMVFKKVKDETRLTHIEITVPETDAAVTTVNGKFDLYDYDTTTITNFPKDE